MRIRQRRTLRLPPLRPAHLALVLALLSAPGARGLAAQGATPPAAGADPSAPWVLTDNSIFIEEAFNQEAGVVQNTLLLTGASPREWGLVFTQEWPVGGVRDQFSYMVELDRAEEVALGEVWLNYRYQLTGEASGRPAMSPRFSVLVPRREDGLRTFGFSTQLPASKRFGDVYLHGNLGTALRVHRQGSHGYRLWAPYLGGSVVYQVRPMLHVLLEAIGSRRPSLLPGLDGVGVVAHQSQLLAAPGLRGGWNLGESQVVLAASLPVYFTAGDAASAGLAAYVSFEGPIGFLRPPTKSPSR